MFQLSVRKKRGRARAASCLLFVCWPRDRQANPQTSDTQVLCVFVLVAEQPKGLIANTIVSIRRPDSTTLSCEAFVSMKSSQADCCDIQVCALILKLHFLQPTTSTTTAYNSGIWWLFNWSWCCVSLSATTRRGRIVAR